MLFVFAWSGVAFNLNSQVYTPVMKLLFGMEDPYDELPTLPEAQPDPEIGWREAHAVGQRLMTEQTAVQKFTILWEQTLTYDPEKGIFSYAVRSDRDASEYWGSTVVYFDVASSALLGLSLPTHQNTGRTITAWITTLHKAKIWGMPMKIDISVIGFIVAMLSVTGIYLWLKKRRIKRFHAKRLHRLLNS
jgi:uncharacterized iron-regulated membrane protein